ncbi:MAG TPA: hypothetical protein PKC19_08795 [Roseiflexaceae bacterium]|nr:hypothetical protein [Roseiflexaceae bacterium]
MPELPAGRDGEPSLSPRMRRLREDPLEVVDRLADTIGARPATSVAEAKAAAYLNGRLRRAGMQVSIDTFETRVPPGFDSGLIALIALVTLILGFWFPLLAPVPAFVCLFVASIGALLRMPLIGRQRISQNVIATRAAIEAPRATVILLLALDTLPGYAPWLAPVCAGERGRWLRVALAAATLAGAVEARYGWGDLQVVAVLLLALYAGAEAWAWRSGSAGAASHAGAAAAALVGASTLNSLDHTQLWVVGLGAMTAGAGLADLLRRYPFERETTLFVGLEAIGRGVPHGITAAADAVLVQQVQACAAPLAARLRGSSMLIAQQLRAAGKRAVTIACLDATGRVAQYATAADQAADIDPEVLEAAAELVICLVRQIDINQPLP